MYKLKSVGYMRCKLSALNRIYYLNKSWQVCEKFDIQEKKFPLDILHVLKLESAVNRICMEAKDDCVYIMRGCGVCL